jgi:hypothetical protein
MSANEGAGTGPLPDPGGHPGPPLDLKLGPAQYYESLTVFPVIDAAPRQLPYQLLADALETETVHVSEVGTGSVPEILVENEGDVDVLILDGEQLVGAMQNRIVSRTIVVPAHAKTTIPVSCMEQGRWRSTSRHFQHAGQHSPSTLRRHARRTEAACSAAMMDATPRVLAGAQGAVWSNIASLKALFGGRSPTDDFGELYGLKSRDLEEWSKHFPWVDDQLGLLAFLGEEPLGLDVIAGHRLYARLHKQLVMGHVMDALAAGPGVKKCAVCEEAATAFLAQVCTADRTEAPTVGRGNYRVLSGAVVGGELLDLQGPVHQSAFPASAG